MICGPTSTKDKWGYCLVQGKTRKYYVGWGEYTIPLSKISGYSKYDSAIQSSVIASSLWKYAKDKLKLSDPGETPIYVPYVWIFIDGIDVGKLTSPKLDTRRIDIPVDETTRNKTFDNVVYYTQNAASDMAFLMSFNSIKITVPQLDLKTILLIKTDVAVAAAIDRAARSKLEAAVQAEKAKLPFWIGLSFVSSAYITYCFLSRK